MVTTQTLYGNHTTTAPRKVRVRVRSASQRSGPVKARYASPSDALAARLAQFRPTVSVTENAPVAPVHLADRSCTKRGWEDTVSRFDDLPGADRSTQRPELIVRKNGFTGASTAKPSATSEELRAKIIAAHAGLPEPVTADPDALISKADRNWVTFVENGGDLSAAVIRSRRDAITPAGGRLGWASQNTGKKIWR